MAVLAWWRPWRPSLPLAETPPLPSAQSEAAPTAGVVPTLPTERSAETQKAETRSSVVASEGVESKLRAFLVGEAAPGRKIAWFELDGVAFEPRGAALRPAAQTQLRAVADILAAHPRARATVAAYGDAKRLSKRRAEAVVAALTRLGVNAARLRALALASKPSGATGSSENSVADSGLLLGVRLK
ncbi:OmpA family protein [Methylosinus sporium]|uniref:OmpA family protein n=1 Tax=Methylosinus sporium TaxID=428 RepID=UPI001FCE3911|nr:OmpA family protein [Methylosinus sporium]